MNDFENIFLNQINEIVQKLDKENISNFVSQLKDFKEKKGRLFFCGSGGGAGHSSHAAADFRKLLNIESYSITDNVSELTARINDEGWDSSFKNWLFCLVGYRIIRNLEISKSERFFCEQSL